MSGFKVNFSVNNQLATPSIHAAPFIQRPAAGQPGRVFIDTDNPSTGIYRDTGSVWIQIASTSTPEADTLQTVTDRGNTTTQDVAIGTSSTPSAPLDVHGAGVVAILQGTGTNDSFLQFNKSGNGKFKVGNVHNSGNDYFTVYNLQENSDAILVNISTNNVAIGGATVTPTYKLDITGSLRNTGNAFLATGGSNVGINTTSISNLGSNVTTLDIVGRNDQFTGGVYFRSSANAVRSYIYGNNSAFILGSETSQSMTLLTAGTERMRIFASTGNVAIGTSTDGGQKLQLNGTFRSFGTSSTQVVFEGTNPANPSFIFNGSNNITTIQNLLSRNFDTSTDGSSHFRGNFVSFYSSAYIRTYQQSLEFRKSFAGVGGNIGFIFDNDTQGTPPAASAYKVNQFKFSTAEVAFITGEGSFSGSGFGTFGTLTANASAILQADSTTKGFLPPRMTGAQAEAIATPAAGLLVYANNGNGVTITTTGWWGYDGAAWVKLN